MTEIEARSISRNTALEVAERHVGYGKTIFGLMYGIECTCGRTFNLVWPRNRHYFHVIEEWYAAGTPKAVTQDLTEGGESP